MPEVKHAHCLDCGTFVVHCVSCNADLIVETLDSTAVQTLTPEQLAQSAAVWHIYEEHPDTWVATIGDRPPVDKRVARAVRS